MSAGSAVAVCAKGEYRSRVRPLLHVLLLLAVALLPLTSFAARAGTAADLTSAAVEIEQSLPRSGQKLPPPQEHRHCTLWAAEAGVCAPLSHNLSRKLGGNRFGFDAPHAKLSGPEAPTPPPKS